MAVSDQLHVTPTLSSNFRDYTYEQREWYYNFALLFIFFFCSQKERINSNLAWTELFLLKKNYLWSSYNAKCSLYFIRQLTWHTRFFLNRPTFFLSTYENVPCKQTRIVIEDKRIRKATITNLWINHSILLLRNLLLFIIFPCEWTRNIVTISHTACKAGAGDTMASWR
jgi:hypothetical protein